MNNKYFDAFNLEDADIKQIKFPLLIWSDLDGENKVIILTSKEDQRILCDKKGKTIRESLEMNADEFNEFLSESNLGDETQHVFKIVEFEDEIINWDSLISEFMKNVSMLPHKDGDFDKKVVDELNNNYIQDLKASLMECVYNSIIFNLHKIATELIIESIGFLGDFSYQERFRQIIHKNLNTDFNVILGN
jgi:hypothetical protein